MGDVLDVRGDAGMVRGSTAWVGVRPACRHCGAEPATARRGLGSRCYRDPAVRDRYPPMDAAEAGRLGGKTNKGRKGKG